MTFVVCTLSKRDFLEQIVVELRIAKKKSQMMNTIVFATGLKW